MGVPLWNQPALPLSELRPTGPLAAITQALRDGATPETLERMMSLQERYEAAQAKAAFNGAIAAAKAEITPIVKTRTAGFESQRTGTRTEYQYEDLAAIATAVDPILARHGLGYRYSAKTGDMAVSVTCILFHSHGHSEETTLTAGLDNSGSKNPIQSLGSALSYLQRYTLKLILGLAAAKDDDGAAAGGRGPSLIDAAQYQHLQDLIEQAGTTEEKVLYVVQGDDMNTLTQKQFTAAKAALLRKINQQKKDNPNAPTE